MTQPRPGGAGGAETWNEPGSPGYSNGRPEAGFQPSSSSEDRGPDADAPRVARLTVASIDVWSALKISFLLSVASAIALVIAVCVLWMVLNTMGVFDSLNDMLNTLGLDQSETSFDIYDYVGFGKIVSISIVLGAVNALIMTALSTVGVLLYNLSSGLVGGVRVTLSDD